MKGLKRFIENFNHVFEYVRIDQFIFEESDYLYVSEKEVKEIRHIFMAFDIDIKEL